MPEWLSYVDAATLLAVSVGGLGLHRWYVNTGNKLQSLQKQIDDNEESDASRDKRLEEKFAVRLEAEKALIMQKFEAHEKADSHLAQDVADIKATQKDMWQTIARMDKNVATIAAKLDSKRTG